MRVKGEYMDIWEKVKKKNTEVKDMISAKLQSNMQRDGRPVVHNAFETLPEEKPVVVPRTKTKDDFTAEECEKILQEILDGDMGNLQQKLLKVVVKCDSLSTDVPGVAEKYTQVCKNLFAEDREVPIAVINAYLELYTKRFNPVHCEELLNASEIFLKKKYGSEYQAAEYGTPIGLFKLLNNQIRERILDIQVVK